MRPVFYAKNPIEAHIVRQFLEQAGLFAQVNGEMQNDLGVQPTVWVNNGDFPFAEALLIRYEEQRLSRSEEEPWNCPRCDSENPPTFDVCWSCEESSSIDEEEEPMA